MTLQQLRDFLAVIAHGGFRPAARVLGVAQAGLTKSVARLEEEHGVVLIERSASGATLTALGVEFHRLAAAVALEADRAEAWLREAGTGKGGPAVLRLGVSIEPSLQLVPAVLADFRRLQPQVSLQVTQATPASLIAALRERTLALAITRVPEDARLAADLVTHPLFESASVAAVRSGHPLLAGPAPVSIERLQACQWLVLGDPAVPGEADASIVELFTTRGLSPPHVVGVTNALFDAIATLVRSDVVMRLPRSALGHPLLRDAVAALPLDVPASPPYTVAAVHLAARGLAPEARSLVAMLGSLARSGGAGPRPA